MYEITVERWQEIERRVLATLGDKERKNYIRSMINWTKRKDIATSRVPDTWEMVEAGDIVFADFGVTYDMEIGAQHLGIVVSIVRGKAFVVPLTSTKKFAWHDNIMTLKSDCLDHESAVLCNDARFINTSRIIKKIGKADEWEWREIKTYVLKGILNNGWEEDRQQNEETV